MTIDTKRKSAGVKCSHTGAYNYSKDRLTPSLNANQNSRQECLNSSHVGESFLPERHVAGIRELEMLRLGYVVEEPLDNVVLREIILSVDHEGGDVDFGKPVVDIPGREIGSSGVHAVRKEQETLKNGGLHVHGDRWVGKEVIERGV